MRHSSRVFCVLWAMLCYGRGGLTAEPLPRFVPTAETLRAAEVSPASQPRRVLNLQLRPRWSAAGDALWYRQEVPAGREQIIRVYTATGQREVVTDDREYARMLPRTSLQAQVQQRNTTHGPPTTITFENKSSSDVELWWRDFNHHDVSYGTLAAGGSKLQPTYAGHVWSVRDLSGKTWGYYCAADDEAVVEVTGPVLGDTPPSAIVPGKSPDGRCQIVARDYNLFAKTGDDSEFALTSDGSELAYYALSHVSWAPNSQHLAAWRVTPGERLPVYRLESSPRVGGRAVLQKNPYPLPGDRLDSYELNVFCIECRDAFRPEVDPIDGTEPDIRWSPDGYHLTYEHVDRGHQRFRYMRVESRSGEAKTLIDERTESFIWTAHDESRGVPLVTPLPALNEFLYATERSGWRHLQRHDGKTGALKNVVTSGEYVVRGIDHIDEAAGQLWFRASGGVAEEDPYFIHHYRVNLDGTGLTRLTIGNGTHRVQFSPDRRFLIDSWSRVDAAPVHVLRRASDGAEVAPLEVAWVDEAKADDEDLPEIFVAKGRDGVTDIWGILHRPAQFDPTKAYPVVEDIYAGPHGAFVPKAYRTGPPPPLTRMGFWVVQIDGMGTAHRSKAFHDVCWKNLKDAGLRDRILWHQAVAKKYPQYDISRVGIFGTSAGGQSSTGAVLFHPEFYKVAVSSCGCHDNRMDKASWNEQWMGYPVGPEYGESSNIDHAHLLQGPLMLIVGELDDNVPPESTLRLAHALVQNNKEFELVVIPGMGHSDGGPYGRRKRNDFFVQHLHGVNVPRQN